MGPRTGTKPVLVPDDHERLTTYLALHPLTIHLKAKYAADFQQVENVRIRPVAGVDPSAWPMVSATGVPQGVPWYLVRAYALLRWSVRESNPDPEALDSALKIIHESDLMLLAKIGLKHALAGKKGRSLQMNVAAQRRKVTLATFDRLKIELQGLKIEALVKETAGQCSCDVRTVYRDLEWRKKQSTDNGAD